MFRKLGMAAGSVFPARRHAALYRRAASGLAAVLVAAGAARADDWPVYQHDNQHTSLSGANFDPTSLTKVWSAPSNYATPLVIGNTVYAEANGQGGGGSTSISSFNLANGAINWTYTNKFTFPSQVAYDNGMLAFIGQTSITGPGSLYVLNASTGSQLYTVALPSSFEALANPVPTLATNSMGQLTAYIQDSNHVVAVTLGSSSGSVAWTANGSFGGFSIPTVVGNSIVVAGPGQYYSLDQTTGAENHFQSGNISGGGGSTVAYDASRHEFYVATAFDTTHTTALTAYSYTNNSTITQLWQYTGPGIPNNGSVAIGPDGGVYSVDSHNLVELNPANGSVMRSLTGLNLANGVTPAIDQNSLVIFDNNNTLFYNLSTLSLEMTLTGSRGSANTEYNSPGALENTHFLLDYGPFGSSPGFDVYAGTAAVVPEPSAAALATIAAGVLGAVGLIRKRRAPRSA